MPIAEEAIARMEREKSKVSPVKVYIVRNRRDEGMSCGLDVERLEIEGQSVLRGLKSLTFKSVEGELDEVTITLKGHIVIEQDIPETGF